MNRHIRSMVKLINERFGRYRHPLRGAEIGVWTGHMSLALLKHVPQLTLFMVDPWENLPAGCNPTMVKTSDLAVRAREEAEKLTQFCRGRCILQMTSKEAAEELKDESLDFVFIDACHLYESVREDIELWTPLVRVGGIVAGHDYNGRGDRRFGWGVKKAVDEAFGDRVMVLPGLVWYAVKR